MANDSKSENKEEGERERRMKEASDALKRSWGETGKVRSNNRTFNWYISLLTSFQKRTDIIRERLDETARREQEEDEEEVARIRKEKEARREELVKKAWEVIRRSKAEGEHLALDGAVMLNNVMEENERSLAVKKEREKLEKRRVKEIEERCRRQWQMYEEELKAREERRLDTERVVAMFQREQVEQKREGRRREVEKGLERRKWVEENREKVLSEQKVREAERRRWMREEVTGERKDLDEERRKRRQEIEEVEEAERVEDVRRREEEEKRRREELGEMLKRRVAVGRRQEYARQW